MWSTMSTAGIPPEDRFEWFTDVIARDLTPVALASEHAADFRAEASVLELGAVRVSAFGYAPLRSRRPAALVRRSDPEEYQLAMVTGNPMWISQHGNDSGLVTDDLLLWDTSRPFEAQARAGGGLTRAVILQIPRKALPVRADRVDRLLARRIPAGGGMGAVLARFMASLGDHGAECGPEDLRRLGGVALDLAAACLAHHLEVARELPAQARAQALREQVKAFIEYNLGDRRLTPQAVADRHHVSLRSLQLLFQGQEEGVGALIRRLRLERCRADLARPDQAFDPIHAVAARWGFTSAAAFSRTFRQEYGSSPREYRQNALRGPSCADPQGTLRALPTPPGPTRLT
ncbi:helix-turn-helix domain-containing protein [Kitasatospora sp. NPDC048239]|uniref:AraC-like ligand-binding domain-containing protein n=1 Tax=Kitasatospora sp. NPDC048239 TaxID=3364046 RepID=UPI0037224188